MPPTFDAAIAWKEGLEDAPDRTGLEPELGHQVLPQTLPDDQEDPRVAYLRSGTWAVPLENLPAEYIDLAVQQAKLVVVDSNLDHGVVMAYDRATVPIPVVLMPLLTSYDVEMVRHSARDHGVAVYANDQVAGMLSDLAMFAVIPDSTFFSVAGLLVTADRDRQRTAEAVGIH